MNLGLIEVDENEVITLANQSFSDISGYRRTYWSKASELVSKESENEISSQNSNKKVLQIMIKKLIKNGKGCTFISGAPNYNLHGKVIGSIGIHLDVTEQKLLEELIFVVPLLKKY
jgi:PAS domain S-box-containing protein